MRKFKATLNTASINNLIKQLQSYRDSLPDKTQRFVDALLDKGIVVAEQNKGMGGTYGTHKMENLVTFSKKLDASQYGCHGIMLGVGETIYAKWFGIDGEERTGAINAITAIEFGTAEKALPPTEMFGGSGGRGTNSKYGHKDDTDWYFIVGFDENKKPIYKHATAIKPTQPMAKASTEMVAQIRKTAKEVFGS